MSELEPQQSRLLSLPGEIRNRIYRLVAVHREPVYVTGSPQSTDGKINFSPRLPGLGLACQKTYDEIKRIYYEENTFNFTEYALRRERLKTFRVRAAQSASKLIAVKITRATGVGFFGCKLQFTIKVTDDSIGLSEFVDEFVNAPRRLQNRGINGTDGICHCLVDKLAARASKSSWSLLDFVDEYLHIDGKLDGDGATQLAHCSGCDKHVMVSSKLMEELAE
jgi:hypothetical protein